MENVAHTSITKIGVNTYRKFENFHCKDPISQETAYARGPVQILMLSEPLDCLKSPEITRFHRKNPKP